MPKKQHIRVASYAVIHQDNQILLCRVAPHIKKWGGYWALPGGGLDFAETPEQAVIREVEEETGLIIQLKSLLAVDSQVDRVREERDVQDIRIIYEAEVIGGELRNEIDGTTDLCQWHPLPLKEDMKFGSFAKLGERLAKKCL